MKLLLVPAAVALSTAFAWAADLSYSERSQITGGSLKRMIGIAGRFGGKNLTEPTTATISFSGGRMASRDAQSGTIIDPGAGTMTSLDLQNKEYSVITFREMAEALAKMPSMMRQQNKDAKAKTSIKVDVAEKGAGPAVAGTATKLFDTTIETTTEIETEKGERATLTNTMVLESAMGKPAGWEAVREFYRAMAAKSAFQPGPAMGAMSQAGVSVETMNEAAKKMAQMDGMAMRTVTKVLGAGPGGGDAPPMPSASEAARESLRGALGGFGRLGRRKKAEEPPKEEKPQQAPSEGPSTMLEMTSEVISLSTGPVDQSLFQVPAGFKKVEHPMKRMLKQ